MSEEEVNHICQHVMELVKNSDKRKIINDTYDQETEQEEDDFEVDEHDEELKMQEEEFEDQLQVSVTEVFGALFKTHKDQCGMLLKTLFEDLLPDYLKEDASVLKNKFALYVVVDLFDHLGIELFQDKLEDCFSVFIRFGKDPSPVLRQACAYGIGIFAQKGGEHFHPYVDQSLEIIKFSIDSELGTQDKEAFMHCSDNAISSLGRIIRNQSSVIDVEATFSFWM